MHITCQFIHKEDGLQRIVIEKIVSGAWFVVYFYLGTSAPHTVCWSKYYVSALKQVFLYFPSLTERKRKKKGKHKNNTEKHALKGVYQCLDVTLKCTRFGPDHKYMEEGVGAKCPLHYAKKLPFNTLITLID